MKIQSLKSNKIKCFSGHVQNVMSCLSLVVLKVKQFFANSVVASK